MPCKQNLDVPESWRSGIGPLYMIEQPPFTIDTPGAPEVEGETKPRRNLKAEDGLFDRPRPDIDTVYSLVKSSAEEHAGDRCIGTRKLVQIHEETKKIPKNVDGKTEMVDKKWQYFELSDYSYITYGEYSTHLLNLASGLRELGLERGDKVHMFASTSANWLALSHACSSQTFTIVTAYDTLGSSGVEHTLLQSEPKVMFTDPHLLKTASGALKKAESVKIVIYNDKSIGQPTPQSDIDAFKSANPDLIVMSVSELASLGEDNPYQPAPPTPEDIYCIMYTSGSTGPPKGVSVTHEGFVAAVAGLVGIIGDNVSPEEVILAYLPLAHILEMVVENLVLFFGATLGYGSSRTLSDQNVRHCLGDMRTLRPTILVGVPQVWETIKKGIIGRVNSGSLLVRSVFWGAFNAKSLLVQYNLPGQTIFDSAIFGQVRHMTGGRLRYIINGASGISKETAHFLSLIMAPMLTGYGLTETCGNGALGSPQQFTLTGSCGPVTPAIECKLVSIPELNYSTSTTPPQGEIWLRGKPVLKEYYKNPEETEKAITPDGWFKTGDIGEFDAIGHLKIIDRVKNLVKLQGGEYIALEKLESVYRSARAVQNIMIHGDSEHPRPLAIILVSEPAIKEIAKELGVSVQVNHELLSNSKVKGAVLKDLIAQGKSAGLTGLETVSGVVLTDEEWTPQNGLVTATQKINRRAVREKYKKEINAAHMA
ncbi:Long-chain-fatty-acid--CoA ligase 1 [Cytospora mali]|uniref:Long-chain-fatty-acid--CoA ligase 1 n=1 Tax=Cytospora mali TaxID=578113 RepID=A0A194UN30_CYTMA|nr:Long-chain-fatty-acid--CoA ligase 1 [Valsa mali var. pyri (nom. inval.)]